MTGGLQRVAQSADSAHVVELSSAAAAVQQAAATAAKGTDRLAVCHGFGIDGVKQGGEGGAVDELARKRKSVHEVECRSVSSLHCDIVTAIKYNRVAANIRSPHSFILVHVF